MKPIGGFFELELSKGNSVYHDNALKLSTGRACFNYILKNTKPTKVYLPFYCCNALYEPLTINNIDYEFYGIDNNLELVELPVLKPDELIVYCDFFGIKTQYTNSLFNIFGKRLVIDNTHSFFHKGYKSNYSFTSARKYFGVPDGAFLYTPTDHIIKENIDRNENISITHNLDRLMGFQEKAFSEFLEYEKALGSKIEGISVLSERLLSNVNFETVRKIRNNNFNFLKKELGEFNKLKIDTNEVDNFCYPLLLAEPIGKRDLSNQQIFIPNLWIEITKRPNALDYKFECKISTELLPLPIDHRYTDKDLSQVVAAIKKLIR